jgi:hypothetical protein
MGPHPRRVAVLDGEVEVAYEALVAGALRTGYRNVQLRNVEKGTPIRGCTLLLHIQRASAPHDWVDDHSSLRAKIDKQVREPSHVPLDPISSDLLPPPPI